MQQVTLVADSSMASKQHAAMQISDWTHKYGKGGAAAMQQMQNLMPLKPSRPRKVGLVKLL